MFPNEPPEDDSIFSDDFPDDEIDLGDLEDISLKVTSVPSEINFIDLASIPNPVMARYVRVGVVNNGRIVAINGEPLEKPKEKKVKIRL